jgi:hypothetical protein
LIDQAQEEWDERNEAAGISPAEAGEMMLPLVRLKVGFRVTRRTIILMSMSG